MLTQARLRELLDYDPATGVFVRRITMPGKAKAGSVAGTLSVRGYHHIRVDGKLYRGNRLAWLYVHGYMPAMVDHIDGDKANDAIANLRPAHNQSNAANARRKNNNTSGYKGVTRRPHGWTAQIRYNRKAVHLGTFPSAAEAHAAYERAAKRLFGEFVRGA